MADIPISPPRRRNETRLLSLLVDVNSARDRVRECRAGPQGTLTRNEQRSRCGDLVDAMEAYASAATAVGVPMSYRYAGELRLYRAMAGRGVTHEL
jgi:hypothetical protein